MGLGMSSLVLALNYMTLQVVTLGTQVSISSTTGIVRKETLGVDFG